MKPGPISPHPEDARGAAPSDWFDDFHDSVLTLKSREDEENGASPQGGGRSHYD